MATNNKLIDKTHYKCTRCKESRPAEEFSNKANQFEDQIRMYWTCKECRKLYRKTHRKYEEDYSI